MYVYMLQIGPNEWIRNNLFGVVLTVFEAKMRSISDIYRSSEVCGASAVYHYGSSRAKPRLTQDHASARSWGQPYRT